MLFGTALIPSGAVEAAKTCKFLCLEADGSTVDVSKSGSNASVCDADSDCVKRCESACKDASKKGRSCATSPVPTCVETAATDAAADAPPPPPTRTPGEFGYRNPLGNVSLNSLIGRIIRTVLGFVGALFLAMFVYGGVTWMLAGGDSKKVESGRTTLLNAIMGIVIVAISYSVISIIFETASLVRGG